MKEFNVQGSCLDSKSRAISPPDLLHYAVSVKHQRDNKIHFRLFKE